MNIRHYEDSDLEAVLSSWETATRLAHPFMTDDFIAQEKINVAEVYMPNIDTWVVEIDDKVHEPTGQQVLRLRYIANKSEQ